MRYVLSLKPVSENSEEPVDWTYLRVHRTVAATSGKMSARKIVEIGDV